MWQKANFSFDFHALEKEDATIQGIVAKIPDILIEKKSINIHLIFL